MTNDLISNIVEATLSDKSEILIKDFHFNLRKKNELLFFFKPECFLFEDVDYTKSILEMVFNKFKQFDVTMSGMLFLKGKRLEKLGIMDRHYGYINVLSRKASNMITEEERKKIKTCLDIDDLENYQILGGHEFLNQNKEFDGKSLDELWLSKESEKLRSGFYTQKYDINDGKFILINGFHPAQLLHFTEPSRQIVVILLHSDTDWKKLKIDMVGNTFPEKANSNSIRGELFKNHDKYNVEKVTIANNFAHLSAGPFEALFEINNFLNNLKSVKFEITLTNIFHLMNKKGLNTEDVDNCLKNPSAEINNKNIDLFSFTEDVNSSEAISNYIKYFKK